MVLTMGDSGVTAILNKMSLEDRVIIEGSILPSSVKKNTGLYENLEASYYSIDVISMTDDEHTVTFQSDYYPCPHSKEFEDVNQVYQACLMTGNYEKEEVKENLFEES